jgi:hypothetical protein
MIEEDPDGFDQLVNSIIREHAEGGECTPPQESEQPEEEGLGANAFSEFEE